MFGSILKLEADVALTVGYIWKHTFWSAMVGLLEYSIGPGGYCSLIP